MIITHFPKTFVFVQMEDRDILEILGNFSSDQNGYKKRIQFLANFWLPYFQEV